MQCTACSIGRTVVIQSHQAQIVGGPQIMLRGSVVPEASCITQAVALEQQRCANTPVEKEAQAKPPAFHVGM